MPHTVREKTKLLNRAKRLRGQIEALERSLSEEDDCSMILHQIVAARGAINGLLAQVIEGVIREHLLDDVGHSLAAKQHDAEELIAALKTYIK
ncbi:metal/formaldehyde-sensitive transcriptional repressor [Dyella acidisoli]